MTDDLILLREYAQSNSEAAFATIVSRYVNLVYSVALRQVGDSHMAEEVTQAVFIILARKANSLSDKTILPGWLCRTARYVGANARTTQRRQQLREQEAHMQKISNTPAAEEAWTQIAPLLDDALGKLGQKDHDALVLRFFQGRNFKEVGAGLGVSEEAAKMRVTRALEKLRKFFVRHGVSSTASVIAGAISNNSIHAAPALLEKAATTVALAKGATASVSTLTLIKGALKIMTWTKAKTVVVTGGIIILATMTTVLVTSQFRHTPPAQTGRLKLPTGNVAPMIYYGYSRDVILLASDGSLWSWGEEVLGWPVLGLANTNIQNTTSLRRIGNETDWVSVAVGDIECLAIKSDGSLWAWGGNYKYQLGDGTKITRPTPVRSIPGNDWKQAAAGSSSFALKNDGTLWAWGGNGTGELGVGDTKDKTNAVQVGTSDLWTKIWGGDIQTVGLQSDGSLWFWGAMYGSGRSTNKFLIPTRISADTNWVDACFGYFTVLALKTDGTLWAFGLDADIYTGAYDKSMNYTPGQVGTENDWQSISSSPGCFYQILRKKDGSLWALDASEHRTIKPASEYKSIMPKKISFEKDIAAYAAGGDNIGIILTTHGEVWTWGRVLGTHSPKDFWDQKARQQLFPEYKNIDKPWRVSNSDAHD